MRERFFNYLNAEVVNCTNFAIHQSQELEAKSVTTLKAAKDIKNTTLTADQIIELSESLDKIVAEAAVILKFQQLNITAVRKVLKKLTKGLEALNNN